MNIGMTLVGSAIFFGVGTALYVFYSNNPASLDPGMPANDSILPFFIMQNLPSLAGVHDLMFFFTIKVFSIQISSLF